MNFVMIVHAHQMRFHPLKCHTSEFVNPESFPSSSELNIVFLKFFDNHDGKVFHGMTMLIEVQISASSCF